MTLMDGSYDIRFTACSYMTEGQLKVSVQIYSSELSALNNSLQLRLIVIVKSYNSEVQF